MANAAGDKNARGEAGRWRMETVLRILRNPAYVGRLPGRHARSPHAARYASRSSIARDETIRNRRTREPSERPTDHADPFLLRGLLVCGRCGNRMTTSSSGKVASRGPRYYRCRGHRCVGAQLRAMAIETRVTAALAKPPVGIDQRARTACAAVASIWDLLITANRGRMLGALFEGSGGTQRGAASSVCGWSIPKRQPSWCTTPQPAD